ncbi:Carbon monoxide dehydrogenase [Hyella patelloides LEGE 07179]|uniref:Carbon monoxide dehydrogenase n=1 Tax=Hyella patelloides LEGE 07179 TaxID=945734 RepID=A0A563VLG3_9CYAN|nr:molybdopterin cofactor-binding domain-containing protein [Hyella patelloides]VEP12279.1 Carbon monoxide dehydrogenase [Hyella patelloides LEGE 07179]
MPDSLNFQVNNQSHNTKCNPGTSLLSLLRSLGYAGVHRVCESGDCGSCTVWLDDKPIHSCIYPAMQVDSHQITTIEGLENGKLSPMQQAFLDKQGFQCGYCTPGMIMTASKLEYNSEAELRAELEGNLCRCTGYEAIIDSILECGNDNLVKPITAKEGQVGKNIPKQDGPNLVTGKPVYTADWSPPGLLHLKVLRSPYPHARIREINTTKAEALEGVEAVFTHKDVTRRAYSTAGHGAPVPDPLDHYLLDNKVRFIGDRVAAVVAETEAIAAIACELIEVDYEILPHAIDPVTAMKGDVVIHDEPESSQIHDAAHNIAGEVVLEKGDLNTGFAEADLILENTYILPAVQHVHLEPHVSISWLDEDGTLVVRSSTQVPFHCQRLLSELFDIPKEKIRVYKPQLGGGFGNKQEILSEDLCVLATLKTGKPVQWRFTREEEFTATNSRHAMNIRIKTGVKSYGTIVAQEMEAISNTGAYGNHGETVTFLTGCFPLGLYRCANQSYKGTVVYTNTMPAGAFRGYGATQGTFAMESQLDEIASKLNIDPIKLRQQNLITTEDEILIGREEHFHIIGSYALDECIEKVTQALDYDPEKQPETKGHIKRGVGFAATMQASGLAKIHLASVKISLMPNGQYELRTGSVDVGTGSDTSLRQIAAEVLGTTVENITIITADTHNTPFDAGSYASATAFITGQAVNLAAQKLRSHLLKTAAQIIEVNTEELKLDEAKISGSQTTIFLKQLAQEAQKRGESLSVELEHTSDRASLTFAFLGVEVEVDTETGRIKVLRCAEAIDIGKAINPRICHGQATGGLVMGLGYALAEELRFNEQGKILNPGLRTYRIPAASDVPPMEIFLIEKADPYGPFGAKGIGEIGTNCTAPAIANAVAQATGVRLKQLPMIPERVWMAMQKLE